MFFSVTYDIEDFSKRANICEIVLFDDCWNFTGTVRAKHSTKNFTVLNIQYFLHWALQCVPGALINICSLSALCVSSSFQPTTCDFPARICPVPWQDVSIMNIKSLCTFRIKSRLYRYRGDRKNAYDPSAFPHASFLFFFFVFLLL